MQLILNIMFWPNIPHGFMPFVFFGHFQRICRFPFVYLSFFSISRFGLCDNLPNVNGQWHKDKDAKPNGMAPRVPTSKAQTLAAAAEWDNRPAAVHVAFASDDDVYKEDNCSFSWNFLN
jgi:hypothetical protein